MTGDAVRWLSLFADVPRERLERDLAFWSEVSGTTAGQRSGELGEYVPLEPVGGDRFLWLQCVDRREGGWHLDLHVDDVSAAVADAGTAGARVDRAIDGLVSLSSPAGQPFCFVAENSGSRTRPDPVSQSGGWMSMVDQLCIDIPEAEFDSECGFWQQLTGWPVDGSDEFRRVHVPAGLPVRLLLQRVGPDDTGEIRAHADVSCDDRAAEAGRHERLGAQRGAVFEGWTTMRDPAGLTYCITDRSPGFAP